MKIRASPKGGAFFLAGCLLLATGYWVLASGFWLLVTCRWVIVFS